MQPPRLRSVGVLLTCVAAFGCERSHLRNQDAAPVIDSGGEEGPADSSNDSVEGSDAATDAPLETKADAPVAPTDASDTKADAPVAPTDASDTRADAPDVFLATPKSLCTLCGEGTKFCGLYCANKQDPAYGCGGDSCDLCHFDHALAKCGADGKCAFDGCWPGWGDCNNDLSDGCEWPLDQMNHCGACGVVCQPNQLCGASGCVDFCDFPLTICHGFQCADLDSELHSCGSCGMTLTPTRPRGEPTCKDRKLTMTCDPGLTLCGIDTCVDTQSDPRHCGRCDKQCSSDNAAKVPHCQNGICTGRCVLDQCGDKCVELFSDHDNCGRCGNSCGDRICYQGQCHAPTFNEIGRAGEAPADWAADRDAFYWGDANRIMRFSRSNNSVDVIVDTAYGPTLVAVDDCYIYWVAWLGSAVVRQEKTSGGVLTVLARTQGRVTALTQDATHIYWLEDNREPTVRRSAKVPSSPSPDVQILATDANMQTAGGLIVDDTSVYYSLGYGKLGKATKDGSQPASYVQLASTETIYLAGASETAFYASTLSGTLIQIPRDGTPPAFRHTWRSSLLYSIADDDANFYATTKTDIVLVPKCADGKATRLIETTTRKLILDRGVIYYFDGASLRSVVAPGSASTSSTLPSGTCSQ